MGIDYKTIEKLEDGTRLVFEDVESFRTDCIPEIVITIPNTSIRLKLKIDIDKVQVCTNYLDPQGHPIFHPDVRVSMDISLPSNYQPPATMQRLNAKNVPEDGILKQTDKFKTPEVYDKEGGDLEPL